MNLLYMETNVKMVGFANHSINGVTIINEGFDMNYDGNNMDINGFSGDKLYYAKLNNKQLVDLLNIPSSNVPLEKRILHHKEYKNSSVRTTKSLHKRKKKSIKSKKMYQSKGSKHKSSSLYVSPKLRSEYRKSYRHSSK